MSRIFKLAKGWVRTLYLGLTVAISLAIFSGIAFARQERVPGSRYTSARIAGMGDSGLVMADDIMSGLFYNPAALPKQQKFTAEPLNVSGYPNHAFVSGLATDSYGVFSLPTYGKATQQGLGGQLGAALGGKFFFAGVLASSEFSGARNSDGTLRYRTTYQLIPAVGTGFKLADGVLRVGYSLQWVNRVDARVENAAAGSHYNTGASQGSGFSQNLGASLTLPVAWLPQAHVVLRNLVQTGFMPFTLLPVASGSAGLPANEPMTMDLAIGAQPKFGMGSGFNFSLGWRDVLNTSATPFWGLFHFGIELQIRNFVFLRGGYASGYPSAGFGIRTKNSDFNAAWYSEEIGGGYLQRQDMRWMLQYQLRIP